MERLRQSVSIEHRLKSAARQQRAESVRARWVGSLGTAHTPKETRAGRDEAGPHGDQTVYQGEPRTCRLAWETASEAGHVIDHPQEYHHIVRDQRNKNVKTMVSVKNKV